MDQHRNAVQDHGPDDSGASPDGPEARSGDLWLSPNRAGAFPVGSEASPDDAGTSPDGLLASPDDSFLGMDDSFRLAGRFWPLGAGKWVRFMASEAVFLKRAVCVCTIAIVDSSSRNASREVAVINARCPICNHSYKVDDKYAGRHGTCTKCGERITVASR